VALAGHSLGGYTVLGLAGAWPSWKIDGIKAVLALSPYCSPYLKNGKLDAINVPVMYQGGTKDIGITPFVKRNGGAYDVTNGQVYFVEFNDAGHFAWTDLKADFQESITFYSLAFLDKHVKGNSKVELTKKRADVTDLRAK
jgi:predicted dienelactone hydrolase